MQYFSQIRNADLKVLYFESESFRSAGTNTLAESSHDEIKTISRFGQDNFSSGVYTQLR